MTADPYDVYARLEDPMGVLAVALGQWEDRDETRPQPEVRRAASTAMDAIDGMLRDLQAMRTRLLARSAPATTPRPHGLTRCCVDVTRLDPETPTRR